MAGRETAGWSLSLPECFNWDHDLTKYLLNKPPTSTSTSTSNPVSRKVAPWQIITRLSGVQLVDWQSDASAEVLHFLDMREEFSVESGQASKNYREHRPANICFNISGCSTCCSVHLFYFPGHGGCKMLSSIFCKLFIAVQCVSTPISWQAAGGGTGG